MKRQEAVKWMQNLKKEIGKTEHRDLWDYEQVLDEIMEILKQESDNDCISRQELLKR